MFSLRYFPAEEEEVFALFSVSEQVIRLSNLFFNANGIPANVQDPGFDPSFYGIGMLTIRWAPGGQVVWLSLDTQEKFIEYQRAGIWFNGDHERGGQILPPGAIDRRLPAEALALPFCVRLVRALKDSGGLDFLLTALTSFPGEVWHVGGQEPPAAELRPDNRRKLLDVVLGNPALDYPEENYRRAIFRTGEEVAREFGRRHGLKEAPKEIRWGKDFKSWSGC
ncbi:MAG: hypothetical protein AB1556_08955 [Bacillota bacterium]